MCYQDRESLLRTATANSPRRGRDMQATPFEPHAAAEPVLHPELWLLIDRGVLSRAENDDAPAFEFEIERAVSRGEVTPTQARTMGQMIGLRAAA